MRTCPISWFARPVRLLALGCAAVLSWSGPVARAQEKIPALAVVPTGLPHDDYMQLDKRRYELTQEYGAFKAAAEAFNAKKAEHQSAEEQAALQARRQQVIQARRDFNQRVNRHITAHAEAVGYRTFMFPAATGQGEYCVVTADGRKLTGEEIAGAMIDNRAKVITGPGSKARFLLPDETSFTVGANSEITIDDFVFDPKTTPGKMTIRLMKGGFRWVTGKVQPRQIDPVFPIEGVGDLGIRGTDFSCTLTPGGSGEIRLQEGELELRAKDTGAVIVLKAGQKLTFAGGKIGAPEPLAPTP